MVGNDLAAKILREKCVSGDAQKMIRKVRTLPRYGIPLICVTRGQRNTWSKHSGNSRFRRYRIEGSMAIREFYSLLRTTIKSARTVGHIKTAPQ